MQTLNLLPGLRALPHSAFMKTLALHKSCNAVTKNRLSFVTDATADRSPPHSSDKIDDFAIPPTARMQKVKLHCLCDESLRWVAVYHSARAEPWSSTRRKGRPKSIWSGAAWKIMWSVQTTKEAKNSPTILMAGCVCKHGNAFTKHVQQFDCVLLWLQWNINISGAGRNSLKDFLSFP